MTNKNINTAYKTLRNNLRQVEVIESLYVIWAYIRNIEKNKPFPSDISFNPDFTNKDLIQKIRLISPWELEILAREAIVHSWLNLPCKKTLRNNNYFANVINNLKNVDDKISKEYITPENVLKELGFRLSHRQFDWQVYIPNVSNLARYFKIFNHPDVSKIIESETGLSPTKIFGIGIILWNHFADNFSSTNIINFDIPEINNEDVAVFEKTFCVEIEELREIIKKEIQVNEKFNYAFHSLKRFPILRNTNNGTTLLICPLPVYIFKQITRGIYYLVEWTGSKGNALGKAFQDYIGDVLQASKLENKYTILSESNFGKSRKDTTDWIVHNNSCALFIECKTKRLTAPSKEELLSDESTEHDLDEMAKAIFQIYKTIRDYRANLYSILPFNENLKIYPMVVTMEDWFLMGKSLENINDKIMKYMRDENIPIEWLETMVYSICSTNEFELISQLLRDKNINEIIETKQKDINMREWTYHSYLNNKYSDYIKRFKELFPDIFKEILPISMKNNKEENNTLKN